MGPPTAQLRIEQLRQLAATLGRAALQRRCPGFLPLDLLQNLAADISARPRVASLFVRELSTLGLEYPKQSEHSNPHTPALSVYKSECASVLLKGSSTARHP